MTTPQQETKYLYQATLKSFATIILESRVAKPFLTLTNAFSLNVAEYKQLKLWLENIYLPLYINVYYSQSDKKILLESWCIKMKPCNKVDTNKDGLFRQLKVCLRAIGGYLRVIPTHKVAKQHRKLMAMESCLIHNISDKKDLSENHKNLAKFTVARIPTDIGLMKMSVIYLKDIFALSTTSKLIRVNVKDDYLQDKSMPNSKDIIDTAVTKKNLDENKALVSSQKQKEQKELQPTKKAGKSNKLKESEYSKHTSSSRRLINLQRQRPTQDTIRHTYHSQSMDNLRQRYSQLPRTADISSEQSNIQASCPMPTFSNTSLEVSEAPFQMDTPPTSTYQSTSSSPFTSPRGSQLKLSISPFRSFNHESFKLSKSEISNFSALPVEKYRKLDLPSILEAPKEPIKFDSKAEKIEKRNFKIQTQTHIENFIELMNNGIPQEN